MSDKQALLENIRKTYGTDYQQLLKDLRQTDVKARPGKISTGPVIARLEHVSKEYKMGKSKVRAVKDVSFEIHEAEIVALVGPSGSGKSSILNLIGGLDKPDEGLVEIDGKDLSKLSDKELSRYRNQTIGFVFQFFFLQPFLNLQTNVQIPMMFKRAPKAEMDGESTKYIEAVGLAERAKHLPNELSGGQIQRTAIARALVNNPKLVLADEPTGNLDRKNGDQIMHIFEEIRQTYKTAILVVTHDEKTAAAADRVIELEDGAIV